MTMYPLDVKTMVTTKAPELQWVVENIAAKGCVTNFYGDPGVGKSLLSLSLAKGVTDGEGIAGFDCRRGPVLLIDGENGENELARRLQNLSFNGQCGTLFHAMGFEPGDSIDTVANQSLLCDAIVRHHASFVILDSIQSLWPYGNENDRVEVGNFITGFQEIARTYNTAILFIHHPNKEGGYAGSRAWVAVPEIAVKMSSNPLDKNPRRKYLSWQKMRGASMPERHWIEIKRSETLGITLVPTEKPTKKELWDEL